MHKRDSKIEIDKFENDDDNNSPEDIHENKMERDSPEEIEELKKGRDSLKDIHDFEMIDNLFRNTSVNNSADIEDEKLEEDKIIHDPKLDFNVVE